MKKRVVVTGGTGFLGKALINFAEQYYPNYLFIPVGSKDYDLRTRDEVIRLLEERSPDRIIHLAGHVGGIGANRKYPGQFFYDNMAMGLHLIEESRIYGIEKFVCIGTVCMYPKNCSIPFKEGELWDGYPEETNAMYGIAKRALLTQLQAYRQEYGFNGIFVIPTNLFGIGEHFLDIQDSHVIPALIRKFAIAIENKHADVELWGDGSPTRDFLYVDDAANGIMLAFERYEGGEPLNLGSSNEVSISSLADIIKNIMKYKGKIFWNKSYPNGQPRRKVDWTLAKKKIGFQPQISLIEGLTKTVDYYYRNVHETIHNK